MLKNGSFPFLAFVSPFGAWTANGNQKTGWKSKRELKTTIDRSWNSHTRKLEIKVATLFLTEKTKDMLYILNYNIKEGKMQDFRKFVKGNEKRLIQHAPKGWKYLGTYFYVLGFGLYHAADMWECKDYADFEAWRNHEDPAWIELMKQSMEFTMNDPAVAWLLREAGDTKITEPKKKP
jgi:hypothetical protein